MGRSPGRKAAKEVFSVGQIAELCGVSRKTVSAWIDRGTLKGFRVPGRGAGERRVTRANLIAFLARHQIDHDPKALLPESETDPGSELTPEQLHDQVERRAEAVRQGTH